MATKISQLQCKEVICISSGQRLGFIEDVEVEVPEGKICSLIVPGPCRMLGLGPSRHDYCIPWSCIRRIGPDIVLVDIKPCDCRVPRNRLGLGNFCG
jgi:YlmC/YmxH family sporulation protein